MELTIDIFGSDTINTISRRLAARLQTLAKFCDFTLADISEIKKHKSIRVTVWDALTNIKNAIAQRVKFDTFIEHERAHLQRLDVFGEVAYIWFYENVAPEARSDFRHFVEEEQIRVITIAIPNIASILQRKGMLSRFAFDTVAIYYKTLQDQIRANISFARGFEQAGAVQQAIVPMPTTPFEEERVKILFTTNITNLSLYEVFNAIVLSVDLPLATQGNFYKVFKNAKLQLSWLDETPKDKIRIKYVPKEVEEPIDIEFQLSGLTLLITTEIEPRGKLNKQFMSTLIPKIVPSIQLRLLDNTLENITGVFYIPAQRLDVYVFEHLVINNASFSNFYVDESEKTVRAKSSIYAYFEGVGELVSIILTPKIMDKYDPTMRDKSNVDFPEGLPYLRVKIVKSKTEENVRQLIANLARVITVYNSEVDNVVTFYRQFIPDFGRPKKQEETVKAARERFMDLDKDLFNGLYTRQCPNRPEFYTEAQFAALQNVDKSVDKSKFILYPKTPQEGTQRYYTCQTRTDGHEFVGLKTAGAGITKYKYVPCCFKKDQHLKKGSALNKYYGSDEKDVRTAQQRLVTSIKFLDYNRYGKLDEFPSLNNILTDAIDPAMFHFLRWGVDRSKRSFLQCILEATDYTPRQGQVKYNKSTADSRAQSLQSIIDEICDDDALINTARQSLFDKSIGDIKEMLRDPETYLDPTLFTQLFETKFECKILVFSGHYLSIPRAAKALLLNATTEGSRVVLILENLGADPSITAFPRCEVLVRANRTKSSEVAFIHSPTNLNMMIIKKIFGKMIKAQTLSERGVSLAPFLVAEAKGQIINSYGKTAGIVTRDDFLFYIKTPIQPLRLLEITDGNYIVRPLKDTLAYLAAKMPSVRPQIIGYRGNSGSIVQSTVRMTTEHGVVIFDVPILHLEREERGPEVIVEQATIPDLEVVSTLAFFNNFQKVARYLTEITIHSFSEFLHANSITIITDDVIAQFIATKTVVDDTVVYKITSKFFDHAKRLFVRGGKLLVKSNELVRKLVFALRLYITQHTQDVFEYYKRTSIESYILDPLDFVEYPQQIVLEGLDSMLKYVDGRSPGNNVSKAIVATTPPGVPYFVKNIFFGPSVYLAINAERLEDAMSIANNWQNHHFVDSFPTNTMPVGWNIYAYNSEVDITQIDETEFDYDKKLVGYKYEDDDVYTVLLRF